MNLRRHGAAPRGGRPARILAVVVPVGLLAVAAGAVTTAAVPAAAAPLGGAAARGAATVATAPASSWTVYHGDAAGSGVAAGTADFQPLQRAFSSPVLQGQLYGEPLLYGGDVYVATTADEVYALSDTTGAVVWSTSVGTPVPSGDLPCGDVSPQVGIVGTPVIDPARGELFAVADELVSGQPAHHLVGLSTATGAVSLNQDVDPPGAGPAALLQRTGLNLDGGNVVFGFGGNYGDCSTYHGWVVSVPEGGGAATDFEVDSGSGQDQGAVWMGGAAPEVDGSGDIWVAAGNGSVHNGALPYDGSDSVIELSPSLSRLQYFAPADWAADNASDRDLGSTAPALLPGQVLQVGKSSTAYLLAAGDLGGIGGQQLQQGGVCGSDADGGDAVTPTGHGAVVYVACQSGLEALTVKSSPPAVTVLWHAAPNGPPVVTGGVVWSISRSGVLYGLNADTGATESQTDVGAEANHFPTPSAAGGLLLVPTADQVVAFTGPATTRPHGPPTTATTAAPAATARAAGTTDPPRRSGSKQGPAAVAASTIGLALLAVIVAVVLFRVRRPRQP